MNVDEAMEAAKVYLANEQEGEPMLAFRSRVAITLAAELERLRAELTVEREAFKLLVNLRAEVLTKLAEAKAENAGLAESHYRVEVELAAAKAASVLPVEAVDCYTFADDVEVVCKCSEDADCLSNWLRARMKERVER